MTNEEFRVFCYRKQLKPEAIKVIEKIRTSEPARKVRGNGKNVPGFYSSKKMGVTIQFESHTLELSSIYLKEHDKDVLEYYDQPPSFPIRYQSNGENRGHIYTADFFVISESFIGWEEWKTEEELMKLSVKSNRYYRGEDGSWYCPPAQEYAEQFGLSFRVCSSSDIDWIFQNNLRFLEDYLLEDNLTIDESAFYALQSLVRNHPGKTLTELVEKQEGYSSDDIYKMIALEHLYVDLKKSLLREMDKVRFYVNEETAKAYSYLYEYENSEKAIETSNLTLSAGSKIQWDGRAFTIVNVGESNIALLGLNKDLIELPMDSWKYLMREGKVTGLVQNRLNEEIGNLMSSASEEDLKEANRRFLIIQPIIEGGKIRNKEIPARTVRHYLTKYRRAEVLYGNGYVGLIPDHKSKGNRNLKLPNETHEKMRWYIENHYENIKQESASAVWRKLVEECKREGIVWPSEKTFTLQINKRSTHEQQSKRKGKKAAYDSEPRYLELDLRTPKDGQRPFEICHIDHTQLDIELICSKTKRNLGRPWATFFVDAYCRRLVAVDLSFDAPSHRSCMMVFRECVRRHGRLPKWVVVDGGREFNSTYFETLLAMNKMHKKERTGKPRYGSVIERLFGTANTTFVQNLLGNTQIMKNVRQVTPEVNPKNNAVWTFGKFFELLRMWAYEVYDTIDHPALGEGPREAYLNGLAKSGNREFTFIPYTETFHMQTMPSTKKGTAKLDPGRGLKINGRYYWSELLRNPEIEYKQIPVRFDPYNMGVAFAYLNKQWIRLHSEYFSDFNNRTLREIQIATEELKRRMHIHGQEKTVTAVKLAQFLRSAEAQEVLLLQRLRDSEVREALTVIEGGRKHSDDNVQPQNKRNNSTPMTLVVNNTKQNSVSMNNIGWKVESKLQMYEEF